MQSSLIPHFRSRSSNLRALLHSSAASKNFNINTGFHGATNFLPFGKATLRALGLVFLLYIFKVIAVLLTSFIIPDLRWSLTVSYSPKPAHCTTMLPNLQSNPLHAESSSPGPSPLKKCLSMIRLVRQSELPAKAGWSWKNMRFDELIQSSQGIQSLKNNKRN